MVVLDKISPFLQQGIAVALKCGATKEQFDSTVSFMFTFSITSYKARIFTKRIVVRRNRVNN